jgi:uncharacterized cupredoxin-like copper-binding protein
MKATLALALAVATLGLGAIEAFAHSEGKHARRDRPISTDRHPWGREGDPEKASRTIIVDMSDSMRFSPSEMKVKRGDTVKFVVRNAGKMMHEMVIGTERELRAHAEMMKKHPGMEHDEPYMAHVAPGAKEEITWTFDKAGTFMYGCLIPGHWEAGMKGTIRVE